MVFDEESLLPPVPALGCAGMVLTEMQLGQGGGTKDLRMKGVCTEQGHHQVCFGFAHLELCSEPGMGEQMEDVVWGPLHPQKQQMPLHVSSVGVLWVYSLSLGLN